jgi:hypothetical protein
MNSAPCAKESRAARARVEAAVSGETAWRQAPPADAGRTAAPRHWPHAPHRDGARGRERCRGEPAHDADRIAAADPAQRLVQLTEELGRLAGEIAHVTKSAPATKDGPDARFIRGLIRARHRRVAAFGADLFADPVWDMMLDLLAARLEGRPVSTSSLCIAAGVPGTTALRWIRLLTQRGLFVRVADPRDGRGVLVQLSDDAAERLLAHLASSSRALSF